MHSGRLTIFNCVTILPTDKTLFLINFPITHSRVHKAVVVVGFSLNLKKKLYNLSKNHKEKNQNRIQNGPGHRRNTDPKIKYFEAYLNNTRKHRRDAAGMVCGGKD